MPIIHVFSTLENFDYFEEQLNEAIAFQMSILYFFVPGVFMFCMGAGIALSRKSSYKYFINRGLKLLLIGLLLNIFRGSVVVLSLILNEEPFFEEFIWWIFGSDILFFAGLFFILYGLLRRLKLNDVIIFIITILTLILSTIIAPVSFNNSIADEAFGNFVYVNDDSFFPLLSWSIFPAAGLIFMKLFKKSKSQKKFMVATLIIASIALLITNCILIFTDTFDLRYLLWGYNDFYVDFVTVLVNIEMILIYQAIIYGISRLIKNQSIIKFFNKTSKNINVIYITHWVLIMVLGVILMLFVDQVMQSCVIVYILGIIVFAVAWLIANFIQNRKADKKAKSVKQFKS